MFPLLSEHPDQHLDPDPDRVIGRLFLPSSERPYQHRAQELVGRVMELDDASVAEHLAHVLATFGGNHHDLRATLASNGALLAPEDVTLDEDRLLLLGAAFTAEYAVEGAALCNPSVVRHPDQSGLEAGELRLAVSLRGIGEGHRSTLEFVEAVVTDRNWTFGSRGPEPVTGVVSAATLDRRLFTSLAGAGLEPDELTAAVLAALPHRVGSSEFEEVLAELHPELLLAAGADVGVSLLRRWSRSGYTVEFGADTRLEQRLLLPAAEDESHGIEDARFTLFHDDDGSVTYRACYTAYDGRTVTNRVLVSPDLRVFDSLPMSGPGARNKGMALFPRRVGGEYLALTREDGTSIGVASSPDGFHWNPPAVIESPRAAWQLLKVGNGSPPLETPDGWLVVTHGVGFLRQYSLGALLLDLDDPTRVLARLAEPLLPPAHAGYVPNVVYTCGAIIHHGRLFVPYGVGDLRIRVGSVPVAEVLDAMSPV